MDLVLERVLATLRQKAATAKYLMKHHPWDCFMILFGESDGTGHQFWKYCDPNSPLFVDQPELRENRVYQELDRQAGEMLALLPTDATVLMMSDHELRRCRQLGAVSQLLAARAGAGAFPPADGAAPGPGARRHQAVP